ncbi:MAG: hypothetical protein OXS33_09530 [bacterium]|nr:hypothetical protein [bacterium]
MPLVGLVRPVRTVGGLDCHGAMHPGLGPRLFKCQQPDAAGVFGLLGWGPGVGLSGVRPSHPRTDDHYPCAHYDDYDACAHYDDHHDAPVAARSHTVSEWDPSEWVWMSCESSSPAVLQGGGVADVYLSLGWGTSDGDGAAVSEDHNHNDYYHYSGDYYHYGGAVGVFERVVVEPKAGVAGFNR